MDTQEVPGIANVLLTLLEGNLISYGVGLISHGILMGFDMYTLRHLGSWGFMGFLWDAG